MTHLWVRHEQRPHEVRVGLTPDGAAALIARGLRVTVEDSPTRCIPTDAYARAGAVIAPAESWPDAPADAIIFGLKELPEDGTPLRHRHILFGHAFKGQPAGRVLLDRFRAGGGTLYDLEALVDADGRRVAAFGYWAGYVGAAVTLMAWGAQAQGGICGPVTRFADRDALLAQVRGAMIGSPRALIIGAHGRVGTGASDLCAALGVPVTGWDTKDTAQGGPFPEVLAHDVFLNCILARPGCPVFVPAGAGAEPRTLRVIGDIACDPTSDFSPIKVYDRVTDWGHPVRRVAEAPPLDVMAIDNLPSLLPVESSQDYAGQLLPSLHTLTDLDAGVWARARAEFDRHL
ncbi:saccharopine dehydrogenase [Falsirhodobacter halotolerans]|uniref:saccharopine dehydrogenase n=1 Tax=Falsirhodobacter halotolerans TaxID=1146892 RepID=UPI001FD0CF1A|nr:saccharopine dehydrogenase [Falsirhodobacter halotolerans]MCJ8140730.1 saccharopine dehydrogenase [Falsirhodobacter halotolerans]